MSLKSEFLRDTFVMTIMVTLSNFFNYIYQLFMGRLLTPEEYGELFSLFSLFYIFSVFFITIDTSVTKFTSICKTRREYGKIKTLLLKLSKDLVIAGGIIFFAIVLLSSYISSFLNIEDPLPMVVLFASIPFALVLPVYQGVLRGLQRFKALGISMFSWSVFRLLLGLTLVLLGFGIIGAVSGTFLAYLMSFLITLIFLMDVLKIKENTEISLRSIVSYGGISFLAIFAYTTMWNIDVILAKHYLSPLEAGEYSAVSVLGKITLFAPWAVSLVIFPKVAEMYEKGERSTKILVEGLVITSLISGGVVLTYALFPEFVIRTVYGERYLTISPYIWRYGLAMTLFSLANVLINYLLSINETNISLSLLSLLTIEVVLLSVGGGNIQSIINMLTIVSILTLITLLIHVIKCTPTQNSL
ncbi:capsular polysaccharide biosynthesis protein [Pyrococcus sp. NA2]|uniref:oligosaccharide flippase family protein n=1 Tax=Pyrococcus sp. (strain NA2) TaxID=342949 RepID=UPI000209AB03|nr:oligosaccharide flippase family protein [Pyrococcus sp. NA2]AEC52037.1 capsular polysaccharide biosynthesis protein [Pyrococcus sp. NA2]